MSLNQEEKPVIRPFKKHIFVCTGPRCAPEASLTLYQWLKERIKKLKMDEGVNRVHRSQCHCFGVCQGGPIVAVYPEGIWYHHVTAEKLERILEEHIVQNRPIKEWIFHEGGVCGEPKLLS